jgi:Cu+-exporting ATPase
MHCPACARTIEKALGGTSGIASLRLDYGTRIADLSYEPARITLEQICSAVNSLGYSARPHSPAAGEELPRRQALELAFCAAGFVIAQAVMILRSREALGPPAANLLQLAAAVSLILLVGRRYARRALAGMRSGSPASVDALVTLAAGSTFIYSISALVVDLGARTFLEATSSVIALIHAGNIVKERAIDRAYREIRSAFSESAHEVTVQRAGTSITVRPSAILAGDIVSVRPGEKLPADGEVIGGTSTVIESMHTGEPMPVRKTPGSYVLGGTINQFGSLTVRATKPGTQTLLAEVERMMLKAAGTRPALAELGDRLAAWFVPAALILSGIALAGWLLAGASFDYALLCGVAVLATACPCALTLAPGAALAVSLGRAARIGLLVRSALAAEKARNVTLMAFDKTGTLTGGVFEITSQFTDELFDSSEILRLAASVEAKSEHPIAAAFEAAAGADLLPVEEFLARAGRGIEGRAGGRKILVGSPALATEEGLDLSPFTSRIEAMQDDGLNVVVCAVDGKAAAVFALADRLRPEASETVAALKRQGIQVVLLTGDHAESAFSLARRIGIEEVRYGLLPEEKQAQVRDWQEAGERVAMVGDGINDAPALAQSFLPIALQTGTELAIGSADIALLGGHLGPLAGLIPWSRATYRILTQNYIWAVAFNAIALPAAAWGTLAPGEGALAMAASSLIVVGNSLRLRRIYPA